MQCPSNQRYIESKCAILRILEPAPANFFQNKLVPAQISQSGNWVLAGRQLFPPNFCLVTLAWGFVQERTKKLVCGGFGRAGGWTNWTLRGFSFLGSCPPYQIYCSRLGVVLKCGKTSMEMESPPLTKFREYNQPYPRQECLCQYLSNSTKI